jgi:integrase
VGEDEQFRAVRSRVLKFAVPELPFEFIEPDRVDDLVAAAGNVRDRFLVAVVAMTGVRIGEALGLRRESHGSRGRSQSRPRRSRCTPTTRTNATGDWARGTTIRWSSSICISHRGARP